MGTPARVVVLPADTARLRVESLELPVFGKKGSSDRQSGNDPGEPHFLDDECQRLVQVVGFSEFLVHQHRRFSRRTALTKVH
jgi:hypothetical protein